MFCCLRYVWVLFLFVMPWSAFAGCEHFSSPPYKEGEPPQFDGPGAFGPLHNTLTLDCLRYIGSIKSAKRKLVLVVDDKGKQYTLRVGDYIGENSGTLKSVTDDFLVIEQIVYRGDNLLSQTVKLKLNTLSAVKK